MRIALLATSGAGKTTFFTGLYGVLTQELSNSGYGINFEMPNRLQNAYWDKKYTKLVDDLDPGEATKDLATHEFLMKARAKDGSIRQINIEIVDFPGEMLHQASQGTLAKSGKVLKELAECNGFIVLLDGEAFISGIERQDPRRIQNRIKPNAVQSVLMQAIEARVAQEVMDIDDNLDDKVYDTGRIPVAFALTKADKIQDWLADAPAQAKEQMERMVQSLFNMNAGTAKNYAQKEGLIANFIRSQFGQIIDHPHVSSMRTSMSVYSEAEKRVDQYNVDHLLQFVAFQLLLNAQQEYDRRTKAWSEDFRQEDSNFKRKKSNKKRALKAFNSSAYKRAYKRGVHYFLPDEQRTRGSELEELANEAKSAFSEATRNRKRSQAWLERVKEASKTNSLFLERILPDVFVYKLKDRDPKTAMYQKRLLTKDVVSCDWWKRKWAAGKSIFSAMQTQPKPGPRPQLQLEKA